MEVAHTQPHAQREARGPSRPHALHDTEQEARAVLSAAAMFVGTPVAQRREEALNKVAMRGVDLNQLESRPRRPPRGIGEIRSHLGYAGAVESARFAGQRPPEWRLSWTADFPGFGIILGKMGPALPRRACAGLGPAMLELDARHSPHGADECGNARKRLDLAIFPKPGIAKRGTPPRRDGRRFDHHEPRATGSARAQRHEMPVARPTLDRRILAHRRDGNAIA